MFVPKSSFFRAVAIFLLPLALLILAPVTHGATFTVINTNDSGAGSLRQAVIDSNNAASSDEIVFSSFFNSAQTIQLNSAIFVSPGVGTSLTITGPGMNLLTVRGSGSALIFSRNVNHANSLLISDMTLTNGVGGAVGNGNANLSLTVTNVAFDSNTASFGGAIENQGQLSITGSTFTGNTSTAGGSCGNGGGAIQSSTAANVTVTIANSTFTNNSTIGTCSGGAIRHNGGIMTITNSTFTNNTASRSGGAIAAGATLNISGSTFTGNSAGASGVQSSGGAISQSGDMSISNTLFDGNSANADGGAIYTFFAGTRSITDSTIANNTANSDGDTTGNGGGLYIRSDSGPVAVSRSTINGNAVSGNAVNAGNGGGIHALGPLTLTNSTVSGNTAGRNCAGVFDGNSGGSTDVVTIESSTIVNNTATGNTGGFCVDSVSDAADNSVHNTIIADNTALGGTSQDISGSINSLGYNLIEDTTGATITGDTTGNITGQDPNLGPLANNGGPTFTHALLAGSPAVDAADPVDFPPTDQRGIARPQDGDMSGGSAPDIGAFERYQPTAAPATVMGRVFANSRPLRGAIVTLIGSSGGSVKAVTNPFGYFRFTNVAAGDSYVVSVVAKRFYFEPQFIGVNADVTDIVFEAQQQPTRAPTKVATPVPVALPQFLVAPRTARGKTNID